MKMVQVIVLIGVVLLAVNYSALPARGAQAQSKQEYKVSFHTEPNPAKGSEQNAFHVSVVDSAGRSVADATVKIMLFMPAMPEMGMAEMKVTPTVPWNHADYSGKANIPSSGLWNVTVQVLMKDRVVASEKTQMVAK
jgi:YtkA-like